MSSWNRNPAAFQPNVSTVLPTAAALRTVTRLLGVALLAAFASRYSSLWVVLLPARASNNINLVLWAVCALSSLAAFNTAYRWHSTRASQEAQQKLLERQRKLMGLPPTPPRAPPPAPPLRKPLLPATPTPASAQTTPMSAPLRAMRTPQPGGEGAYTPAQPTPGSTGMSRPSPPSTYSAAAVATPKQLQHYLDTLNASAGRGGAGATGAAAAGMGGQYFQGTPGSGYGGAAGGGAGTPMRGAAPFFQGYDGVAGGDDASAQGADQADAAPSPVMPYGVELPKYRPSWLPRGKTAQSFAAPDVLEAITEEEAEEFLWAVVRVRHQWLEIWTERLREWFATRVLKPLTTAVATAHASPNAILAKYGHPARLPPLPSVFETGGGVGGGAGGGGGGGVGGAGAAGGGVEVEAVLRGAQQAVGAMQQQPNVPGNAGIFKDAVALGEALVRYEQLLLLLRGRRPAELLPPSPPGYLWNRVQQLAQGTCVPQYNWNSGGTWAGRPWSPDLPTDSLLMLYLFAAFIDAPGWEFAGCGPGGGAGGADGGGVGGGQGAGVPLFLGAVRAARPPALYSAILAYRPEKPGRGLDAVLALNQAGGGGAGAMGGVAGGTGAAGVLGLPGATTVFGFLAEGRLLALTGYNSLFHTLLTFLAYHKTKYSGALGGHYLQDASLQLADVIEPPEPGEGVVAPHNVFGWWFPPRRHAQPRDKND